MYQRRRARGLLVLLVLVSLTLITIDFRSGSEGPLVGLRRIATAVFEPVQSAFSSAMQPVTDGFRAVGDTLDARAELSALREEMAQINAAQRSYNDLARENAELRGLLDVRDRVATASITARVVAQSASNLRWTVTIDVGSDDGIERDMVVVNADGLVGRILQVTAGASRVLLAIDPNFKAAARVATLGEIGTVEGQGGELMRYTPLDPEIEVGLGEELVTSGYSNGVFPPGIPIGEVEEVGHPDALLDRALRIRPYVDFSRLNVVLVVLQSAIEPPPDTLDSTDLRFTPPILRNSRSSR